MLRHFRNLLGMLSMLVAFGGSVHAEVGVDLNAAFYSDYMFRGFNLYDGASIQPSVGVSYDMQDAGAVRAGLWSHLSAEGGNGASDKFTELDYILSYDISAGLASFSAGHIWYTFPRDSDGLDDTGEFYGAVSFDTLLSPTVSVYYDYDLFDAFYYELGLSHTISNLVGEGFNMTPFVSFGFASDAEKVYADDGLVQVTFGTSFDAQVGDVTVSPSFNVTREQDDLAENEFWFGTNFSYSF